MPLPKIFWRDSRFRGNDGKKFHQRMLRPKAGGRTTNGRFPRGFEDQSFGGGGGRSKIYWMNQSTHWCVAYSWDGYLLEHEQQAEVTITLNPRQLHIHVQAPFHGNPPPSAPPGHLPGLWEHEVLE